MRTVWKYPLDLERFRSGGGTVTEKVRAPGVVLHFALQDGIPTVWCEVDTHLGDQERTFRLVGTGHPIDFAEDGPDFFGCYQGTIQLGAFVFHLYEVTDSPF